LKTITKGPIWQKYPKKSDATVKYRGSKLNCFSIIKDRAKITKLLLENNVDNGNFSVAQKRPNAVNVAKMRDYLMVDVLVMMPLMFPPMHHVTNTVKQVVMQ